MPQRPGQIRITDSVEDDRSRLYIWVEATGRTIQILVPPAALVDRKLAYGFAHREVDLDAEGNPSTESVVDVTPDADELALRAIIAEHFDRFDDTGHDWTQQHPPARAAYEGNPRFRARPDLAGTRPLAARAPERLPPRAETRRS